MAKVTAKTGQPEPAPEPVQVQPAQPAGKTSTPPAYTTGSVKQDPTTLAVAVRTNIPDPYEDHAWGVMTIDRGGHYAGWDDVQNWTDLAASKDEGVP
jgi:hypothetical protein